MEDGPSPGVVWTILGITGGLIFYGRFYVQWIVSERRGRSVMPTVFWYMSSVGSVLLLTFAIVTRSPVGALGQSFNIVVYGRNLIHIWRERGALTRCRNIAVHSGVAIVSLIAASFVVWIWLREYEATREQPAEQSRTIWFWLGVGVVGQAMFAARFLIQLLATEIRRRSVIPRVFWYLSLAAALLQSASFMQRREWVFAIGLLATVLIYARNIWFVHTVSDEAESPV